MDFRGYNIPDDLLYTPSHEWAKEVGSVVRVGITDYAAKMLNDVVYVAPPKLNEMLAQSMKMGTVESIKAVSELYTPFSGTTIRINTELALHPELINKSPYGDGWIVEMEPLDFDPERENLLDAGEYAKHLASILNKQTHH